METKTTTKKYNSTNKQKTALHGQHTFSVHISLPLFRTTTTSTFQKLPSYTFYGGNFVCVRVRFFSLPLIFTLVDASISNIFTDAVKVSCFSSSEIGLKQSKNFE